MTLLEVIQAGGRRTNKPVSQSDVKTRFIDHVHFARRKAWNRYNWSWKNKVWSFPVTDQIITGTASVTLNSRSVVLASATLSSSQVGWYFQVYTTSPSSWYRVVAVSGTTITLDQPYQAATNTVASYYLRGFDWLLPSELEGMPTAIDTQNGELNLYSMPNRPLLVPDMRGRPNTGIIWADDPIGTTYSTGTLSVTTATRTWTGVGTSWLANVKEGDQLEITIGSTTYKYHVQSIQSDTSLTTYQYAQATSSAVSYVTRNQFARYIRLTPTPDNPYVLQIKGQRKFYPLSHDNDIDELLSQFDESFVEAIEAYEAASTPDDRENDKYNRWLIGLNEKIGIDARNFNVKQPAPIANPWGSYRA